ncbi:uncharacterized protein TM35_000092280 [Trypanosoma theileri]|uniref:Uncharacterized protein n=1 Tax=Trypanosoma theileri TaxID=67003 RepID=A0A1X0P058_9TRYP|nr:uncharacterized protein TM35_000092280 [Trypanosoma theileri]ORC90178.1 hypothetical protein TM35_000092280 [Trypanosoma theileri]
MSFNPISMDDDGVTSFDDTHRPNGVVSYTDVEGNRANASICGVTVIDPKMSANEFIRRCKLQYYYEFSWRVPFPQVPAAPLLYLPEAFAELLRDPAPLGVMGAELDAMAAGVMERIPLAHPLLRPEEVGAAVRLAAEGEERLAELQRRATAAGLPERLTWKPEEVNPHLNPADAALLDTDIDLNLVLERDKPSLTLLQRPLYTDMGLVPQEQRHLERLARIVPETLRSQIPMVASQESERLGNSMSPPPGVATQLSLAGGLTQTSIVGGKSTVETTEQWLDGVRKSFRFARTVDSHYDKLLESVARAKLGLDSNNPVSVKFTRRLWHQLFDSTSKNQQRDVWHQLCRFSSNYDGSGEESLEQLERSLQPLNLPHKNVWLELIQEYVDLLRVYTSKLNGGVEKRKEQLQFSGKELDPFEQGAFEPDLQVGSTLRRVGKEFTANRQPVPIFPVEVVPLYPADFDKAAAAASSISTVDQSQTERLGEMETELHHIVLPGAVVSEESKVGGPHALVNDTNLLVVDKKNSRHLSDGITVSYHTSRENTFESLVTDENNTSSYLFQLRNVQGEGSIPTGFANANGHHVVYRRLGLRKLFVKAPNAEAPPYEKYVLMFGADDEMAPEGAPESTVSDRKRQRDLQTDIEERHAIVQRME